MMGMNMNQMNGMNNMNNMNGINGANNMNQMGMNQMGMNQMGMGMSTGMNTGMSGMNMPMNPNAGLYNPSSGGTLIADLIKKDGDETVNNNKKNKGDYNRPSYRDYYRPDAAENRSDNRSDNRSSDSYRSDSHIKQLANDVNHSLKELENLDNGRKRYVEVDETDNEIDNIDDDDNDDNDDHDSDNPNDDKEQDDAVQTKRRKKSKHKSYDNVQCQDETHLGKMLMEPIILLTLYVIMSQPFFLTIMSDYINQLNPSEDGSIGMGGILIYGFILTVSFLVIRKIVFYNL